MPISTHNIREFWGQNFHHRHSANLILFCDFLRCFETSFQKNVKSHVFLKSEKNVKYVFSNTDAQFHTQLHSVAYRGLIRRGSSPWRTHYYHWLRHELIVSAYPQTLYITFSLVVKGLRLKDDDKDKESSFKDKDKNLMSKDEDIGPGGSSRTRTFLEDNSAVNTGFQINTPGCSRNTELSEYPVPAIH